LRVGNDEIEFEVTSDDAVGGLAAAVVRMPPGGGPPALHRHAPAELYRVERGEFAFYLEGEDGAIDRFAGRAGETVAIPCGREHTVRNESEAEAVAFVVYAPGAEMEAFARAAAGLAADGPPPMERVLSVAAAHGIEVTRPLAEVA
jgi:oxalate decarboxylase/phosphoglucose isomerase-like protein (cupin superfamily)